MLSTLILALRLVLTLSSPVVGYTDEGEPYTAMDVAALGIRADLVSTDDGANIKL